MSGNFNHKIFNFELIPPPEVWSKVADQLDEEFKTDDIHLSQKLHDYEINPPALGFENLLVAINKDIRDEKDILRNESTPRAFKLPVKRLAMAAIAIGIIVITLFYLAGPDLSTASIDPAVEATVPSSDSTASRPPATETEIAETPQTNQGNRTLATADKRVDKKPIFSSTRITRNVRNTRYASLASLLQTNARRSISVFAPPICDGDGNIILDEDLVSAPDDNYIIVTSPNGEQTKMSRKFLKVLTIMNGGSQNVFFDTESFLFRARVEEWRSKLLQQASYIPTANNFLDIVDLKEMLQEN